MTTNVYIDANGNMYAASVPNKNSDSCKTVYDPNLLKVLTAAPQDPLVVQGLLQAWYLQQNPQPAADIAGPQINDE